VDAVVTFTRGETPFSVGANLRGKDFDLALVLPNSPRSALEVWFAGIPQRVGYEQRWRSWFLTQLVWPREGRVQMVRRSAREVRRLTRPNSEDAHGYLRNTIPYDPAEDPRRTHQIHEYLHLVAAVGADPDPLPPRLEVLPEEIRAAQAARLAGPLGKMPGTAPVEPARFLGLSPSAAYGPAKRWPAERFATAAREVARSRGDCCWLLFGSKEDWEICEQITRSCAGRSIRG
jgi:heptosyltransferase-2